VSAAAPLSPSNSQVLNLQKYFFPLRVRSVYLTRQPWYFNVFWWVVGSLLVRRGGPSRLAHPPSSPFHCRAIVKPLLKKKLASRLHLLGHDLSALHEVGASAAIRGPSVNSSRPSGMRIRPSRASGGASLSADRNGASRICLCPPSPFPLIGRPQGVPAPFPWRHERAGVGRVRRLP
jgi:hypothetical protein